MTTRLEWTGSVIGERLQSDDGSDAPEPTRMLWLFTGRHIRIVIEDLGAADVVAEPFALCANGVKVTSP
jgi:hypothetical protein